MFKYIPFTLLLVSALLVGGNANAQEIIAHVDFDTSEAKYQFSYAFGGYGASDGSGSVSIADKLSAAHSIVEEGGMNPELAEMEEELAKLLETFGAGHPDVKSVKNKMEEASAAKNKCGQVSLDSTEADVPGDASYQYAGFGAGVNCDLTGKKFENFDPKEYEVSFSARVSGAEPLSSSKLMINFVTEDGSDEDTDEDVVLRMVKGESDGTDTFEINSEWQSFTFSLDDLLIEKGKTEDLAKAALTGVAFNVQGQGSLSDFGNDKDNLLFIDNLKLIKK